MKKTILFLAMALALVGCHNTQNAKTSADDVKKAEAALFNEDKSTNVEAVANAIETFSKYAEANPKAADAPEYLFKAIEVSINTYQDAQQSIDLVNKLVSGYPTYDKNPVALFMLASFVYEDQKQEYEKARETYQQIVDNYPDSPFAHDAAIAKERVGMTPEQLIELFEANQE